MKAFLVFSLASFIVGFVGCRSKQTDDGLVPVRGVVTVDGEPAVGVVIELHPETDGPALSKGVTSDGGMFEISTHRQGDGVAPGVYDVTFVWSEFNVVSRSQEGDRLNGRYATKKATSIQWNVPDQSLFDAGSIALTTTD